MRELSSYTIYKYYISIIMIAMVLFGSCSPVREYDVIIRHGTIYDGSGSAPYVGDVAILADQIAALGALGNAKGKNEIDASGLAIAPGFINVLSWATDTLMVDGCSQSDIRQGVTLEIFGEGLSMGPVNEEMKKNWLAQQGDIKYDIPWNTLGQFLEHLIKRGISPNIASFVGASTIRVYVLGYENRPPSPKELERMCSLVKQAMEEGALGVGSALIYTPACYAKTEELIALCKVAATYNGAYISHLRSEGNNLLEGGDELLRIAKEAGLPAEIYHLKAAGQANWGKLSALIKKVEAARAAGIQITANMYTYTAAATGLDAAMPPWVQEGGLEEWIKRLKNPTIRHRVIREMKTPAQDWENLYYAAGSADRLLLTTFNSETLKPLIGKTLAEIAQWRGKSPEETVMDLVIEDGSRVGAVYFLMDETNVKKEIALPWVSFGSDECSAAPEGVFLKSAVHPRAYGNFARLLGKYVRDEKVIPLAEAIRKLTSLPAQNFKLTGRGRLKPGYYADVVVFAPDKVLDHATYDKPHQYATGMVHVFVNGIHTLKNGEHTGAKAGQIVRGPGWRSNKTSTH